MPILTTSSRNQKFIAFFFSITLIIALLSSKFLMTVSMIGLTANVVFFSDLKSSWKKFISNKALLLITSIFFIYLFSGLNSELTPFYFERLRIKLPFLILPFVFAATPPFSKKQYYNLLYFLLLLMTLISIGVGINYLLNYDEINLAIQRSQYIPTPINHIRFSLLIAISIITGLYLFRKEHHIKWKWEKWIILTAALLLIFLIHIFSVRSGLLALYAMLFILSMRYIFVQKKYLLGSFIIAMIIAVPVVTYSTIPSFKSKIDLTVWNYKLFLSGKIGKYSDTQRMVSYDIGYKIFRDHPIIGCGIGDLQLTRNNYYKKYYSGVEPKYPHNQFLFYLASTGIIGAIWFLVAFLFPLLYKHAYKDSLLLSIIVCLFFSLLFENTIETAIGTTFYIFFLLISLQYVHNHSIKSTGS